MDYDKIQLPYQQIVSTDNIAELLDDEQLRKVGQKVCEWYDIDKASRAPWEKSMKGSLKLAQQVMEDKTYPWANASNVKFPLLTVASLQFSARVYPALVKAPDLVKFRVMGVDPKGKKAARAQRISRYLSYQLLEQMEEWEEEQDKLFIALPILGCMFKKTFYDPSESRIRSTLVMPHDLVIHYWAKDLKRSRITERFELYAREIRERQLRKTYLDTELTQFGQGKLLAETQDELGEDTRQGIELPYDDDETPREILECHCFWDFDGDGYAEPYIVTVDRESSIPLRIKARFKEVISEESIQVEELKTQNFVMTENLPSPQEVAQMDPQQQMAVAQQAKVIEQRAQANAQRIAELEQQAQEQPSIIKIIPKEYYTKYSFLPAPDGGYYDLGFGQLLGPLNESVNTLINQLIDSGSLQNSNSGFIGRGARISGGTMRFEPGEWKPVSSPGSTIRDSIVPLPVNQPSQVLFELLGLLISYSERVSSVSDIMSGDNPGQNTPAYNMKAMLEQGMQVFNGVFKRIYRSFRGELRKIYVLNGENFQPMDYTETMDMGFRLISSDFTADPKDILPAADPNAFSNVEKISQAQFLMQRAMQTPGYNAPAVEKRLLTAMDIPDVDEVYPTDEEGNPVIQPPPNPELELEKAELQRKVQADQMRSQLDGFNAQQQAGLTKAQTIKTLMEAGAIEREAGLEKLRVVMEVQERTHDEQMRRYDEYLKELDVQIAELKVEEAKAKKNESGKKDEGSSE